MGYKGRLNNVGIYKITNPKGLIYIGQSVNLFKRLSEYKGMTNCSKQFGIYNSLVKYGPNNHTYEILETCEISELNAKERYYQEKFNSVEKGLNCRLTKSTDKSGKLSKETIDKLKAYQSTRPVETIAKISESRKGKYVGELNHFYGKKLSIEHKAKLSEAKKGVKNPNINGLNQDHKNAIGKALKGRVITWADKVSKTLLGTRTGIENHNSKIILCFETGIFYYGVNEASLAKNISANALRKKLCGYRKNNTLLNYI